MESNGDVLRTLSTPELVRHAVDEAKLLARAEMIHAKSELRAELRQAKRTGILLGTGLVLALCGLSTLFAALSWALPLSEPLGGLVVGGALLLTAGGCALGAYQARPKQPLPRTAARLKQNLTLAKERFA